MDDYQKLIDEYGDQVNFIMLNVNDSPGEADLAREYMKEHNHSFSVYFDSDSSVVKAFAITGIPVSIALSADGDPLMMHTGSIDYETMKATIRALLSA